MRKLALCLTSLLALIVLALPSAAAAADRDRDGLPDRWEKKHKLSLKKNSANGDLDRDRVDNRNEYREGTKPRDKDSDDDGKRDGSEDADRDGLSNGGEDATGNDPKDRDTDDDGVIDGREHAGVVTSFEDGVLTLDLPRRGVLSGYVTDYTDLLCSTEHELEKQHSKRRGGKGEKASASNDEGESESEGSDPDPYPSEDELEGDYEGDELGEREDGDKPHKPKCSLDDVKPGARVHEAKLKLTSDGLVFKHIQLVR